MENNNNSAITPANTEQELAKILASLNPPQQNYASLADRAWKLWSELSPQSSIERELAAYFGRFAQGYVIWRDSYDYPKVHEYFYAAYLETLHDEKQTLLPELREILAQMTDAMIAYTHCENALISNDPAGLSVAATQAIKCGAEALRKLAQTSLSSLLRSPIQQYLDMNIHYFQGLRLCGEMYLAPSKKQKIQTKNLDELSQILDYLGKTSRELASELRAHVAFVQNLAKAYDTRKNDLRVKEGSLWLRATGYLEESQTKKIFDRLKNPSIISAEEIRQITHLPIVSVRRAHLQDIFETVLGEEYLDQIIFELACDDDALTFVIRDGEREIAYAAQTFQIVLTRFGAVSLEIEIFVTSASISHIRVLESLITPHAGEFDFIWRDYPKGELKATHYMDYFLRSRAWIHSIEDVVPGTKPPPLIEMELALKTWEKELAKLTRKLPYGFQEVISQSADDLATQQCCFQRMDKLAQQWIEWSQGSRDLAKLAQQGKRIFPEGSRFSRLMDVAQVVLDGIETFLVAESTPLKTENGMNEHFSFDPNTGWATIFRCDGLTIVERSGKQKELKSKEDHHKATEHDEFKGLIIQSREARSAIDDWLFVATPEYQNLATIRSHEHDVMHISGNRAFLYLPDDPQFLTDQYIQTIAFIDNIRNIVLSFNESAKDQIKKVEEIFAERATKMSKKSLDKFHDTLQFQSNQIEGFRTRADKILDLLRSCTVSKYQDHSELLNAMIRESRLNATRDSLEHNIATLEHFHTYLTQEIKRQIDDRSEKSQKSTNRILFVVTTLGIISVIPLVITFFQNIGTWLQNENAKWQQNKDIMIRSFLQLLIVIILAGLVVFFIVWQNRRKSRKKDENES